MKITKKMIEGEIKRQNKEKLKHEIEMLEDEDCFEKAEILKNKNKTKKYFNPKPEQFHDFDNLPDYDF